MGQLAFLDVAQGLGPRNGHEGTGSGKMAWRGSELGRR